MWDTADLIKRFPGINKLSVRRRRRRVPIVRQQSVTDCGAAALSMVLAYHGREIPLRELKTVLESGRDGSSAASILRVGRAHGLRGRGVRLDVDNLGHLPCGTILHWEFRHFVVFERIRRDVVDVVDPASGRRSIPIDKVRRAFTGIALLFEPSDTFVRASAGQRGQITGLYRLILERRDLLTRIVTTSVLLQILSLALPLFTGIMIDRVVPRKDYSLLLVLTVGYLVFQLASIVGGFVRAHLLIHLQAQLELRFTLRFLDHLIRLPYSYFQQHTSGDLMIRLGSNTTIRSILTSTALSGVMDGTMASLYLVLLLLANVQLTLLVIGLALARFALLAYIRSRQRQFLAESLENQSRSQTAQIEMLAGMETLKAMGLEHRAAENWSNIFIDGLNISLRRGQLDAVFNGMLALLGASSGLVLSFYGTYLVLNGTFTLGTMIAFGALAAGFLGPLNGLLSSVLQLQLLEVYLDRMNDVIHTAPEQDDQSVSAAGILGGGIGLDSVSFKYAAHEPLVIRDITLEIPPGSRVALVGPTGSGKSTLARLIAGLYEPTAGRVRFDERDLKTLDRQSVRSQIGTVTQDTQLFGGSIRRNIALADPQMGLDRVVHAAKIACLHDEIMAMGLGYETPLSDRGLSMSGGQRQRLALARALANEPKILILDEATSHLDSVTEHKVNRNLAALRSTRIVIAHRLSTIRDADLIVVIDGGKIVEQGTHQQLLDMRGVYSRLVAAQQDRGDRIEPTQNGSRSPSAVAPDGP